MVCRIGEALTPEGVSANRMQALRVVHAGTRGETLQSVIGRDPEAEIRPVRFQFDRWQDRRGGRFRRPRYGCRCRMLACREWEGVSKDPDRDAGSRLGGHAELPFSAAAFRRQLLHNPVVGAGIGGQTVSATEGCTAQRGW